MTEFKCEHCGKVFDHEAPFRQHINDKHAPKPEPPKPAEQPVQHVHHEHRPDRHVRFKMRSGTVIAIVAVLIMGVGGYFAYGYLSGQPSSESPQTASALSAPIGAMDSANISADFALWLNGTQFTPLDSSYYAKNAFVNVGPDGGSVIHMHATNVQLGFFFRSLGMNFNSECFRLDNGKEYCSQGNFTLKMFVRHAGGAWEENRQFHTYVFQQGDKILIAYGNETAAQIQGEESRVGENAILNDG